MAIDKGAPTRPPRDLHSRKIPLARVAPTVWWRIHRATSKPCFFSPDPANRFSSAGLSILYVAEDAPTAFWEIFWDDLATRPPSQRRISQAKLNVRRLTPGTPTRSVTVFDATNPKALRAVGAPTATLSGDYFNCQAWALALRGHP